MDDDDAGSMGVYYKLTYEPLARVKGSGELIICYLVVSF